MARPIGRMLRTMRHRGPDGEGEYSSPQVSLAMRRLSIIDLEGGWQPLYNEDRSLVLVANGEIYNHVELRQELIGRGHHFRTGSDCETILHLYEEFGLECLRHLRGMFAFALWDEHRRRVMLARDRMGEKPLYLREEEGRLWFASELKSIVRAGISEAASRLAYDPVAIDHYFHYGYVPEPMTPLAGIRKLPAGHYLTVDLDEWQCREAAYWNMEDAPPLEGDPGELIREQLEGLSRIIVRADVPVGVALSGGLDSSAIAALATAQYPGVIRAFSVGYANQPANDERADAREFARYLRIPFEEVELRVGDLVAFFPELVFWQDDPIADIAGYGYYSVMKLAREHGVPVLLQGHGGDELFWGYPWSSRAVVETARKARSGTDWSDYLQLRFPTSFTARDLLKWALDHGGLKSSLAAWRRDRSTPAEQMVFYDLVPDFANAQRLIRGCYAPGFAASLADNSPTDLFSIPLPWGNIETSITRLLCQTYLLENGVAQGDRLSMAASVELRLPLLDHRLIETVIGLRKQNSDSHLPPKAWFRQALAGILPRHVLDRPKRGFAPPVRAWHRAIFAAHGSHLDGGMLVETGLLTHEAAKDLARGDFPYGVTAPLSFKALVLEEWSRHYLN